MPTTRRNTLRQTLSNRQAARLEEIKQHGKPVSFRNVLQKSKKVYNRKRLKKEIPSD